MCPHLGLPLEWQADRFLTSDRSLIQCASNGALFEIETGVCIDGPCPGQKLQAIQIALKEGYVFLSY